jgi:hypothetical protein
MLVSIFGGQIKSENMPMVSRSLGIVAVMVLAVQSVGQAGAACQNVEGAVCGGAGKGSISSVMGNVSLAQGGGVLRATAGASVSPGARLLAGEGGMAQVNLGAGCFTSVMSNSVATFTSRDGLTCLRKNEPFTAQANGNGNNDNGNAGTIGAIIVGGVIAGTVIGGVVEGNTGTNGLSP